MERVGFDPPGGRLGRITAPMAGAEVALDGAFAGFSYLPETAGAPRQPFQNNSTRYAVAAKTSDRLTFTGLPFAPTGYSQQVGTFRGAPVEGHLIRCLSL